MIEVPSSTEQVVLTDWVESSCLFGDIESISQSSIQQAIEQAEIKNPELVVSDIWQEISRRHSLADKAHPIKTLIGRLERTMTWSDAYAYTFQLLLASHRSYKATMISANHWKEAAKLFEKLSTLALKRYLQGRAINIGSPRGTGVPKGFRQCLDCICLELRELRGDKKSYNLPTKDEKVDVVAWLPFPDMRAGQVIIFAQCAAGADWKTKAGEISLDLWRDYINWLANPLIAFSFPFVLSNEEKWRQLSKQNRGFLLDRLRISSMLIDYDSSDTLVQQIKDWCNVQLKRLPWRDR